MPADHGRGLHEDQGLTPVAPDPRYADPEQTVSWGQAYRVVAVNAPGAQLVSERQNLEMQGRTGANEGTERAEDETTTGITT